MTVLVAVAGCGNPTSAPVGAATPPPPSSSASSATPSAGRVVSLTPSLTEVLFALGLGSRVVGVTQYCDYPPEVESIKRVGGFVDPSIEEILALKPDLAVLSTSQRDIQRDLARTGVHALVTPEDTLADIASAIRLVGEACGVPDRAAALSKELALRAAMVRGAIADRPRPRVLVCVGRDMESGRLSGMYVAGRHGYYNEIVEAAGGVNVYTDEAVAYPQVSAEGVIELNPDVIIDLVSMIKPHGKTADEMASQWMSLHTVNAVSKGRVHVIVGNHALRPGPRYIQFLEETARLLHPDAFPRETSHE